MTVIDDIVRLPQTRRCVRQFPDPPAHAVFGGNATVFAKRISELINNGGLTTVVLIINGLGLNGC